MERDARQFIEFVNFLILNKAIKLKNNHGNTRGLYPCLLYLMIPEYNEKLNPYGLDD